MTEIETREPKHVVSMKSGLTHLVKPNTALNIERILVSQQAHSFIRIEELAITINTAEVEGVYTPDAHDEMLRIKGGEYKCTWNNFHPKKVICDCKTEFNKRERQRREKEQRDAEMRPPTEEERKKLEPFLQKTRAEMIAKGVIHTKKSGAFLNRSKLNAYELQFGIPYQVPAGYTIIEDV